MKQGLSDTNAAPNVARARLKLGKARWTAEVRVTSGGLLAIGGLVSSILLSTAILVAVATTGDAGNQRLPSAKTLRGRTRR